MNIAAMRNEDGKLPAAQYCEITECDCTTPEDHNGAN